MIYIDADERLTTWRRISRAGDFPIYRGNATNRDTIIRWGCNYSTYSYPRGARILNPRIILSKVQQGRLFEAARVPIPKIFRSSAEWARASRPQLIQKPAIGQAGTGIRLIHNPTWNYDVVYQLYIDKQREFRAMMVKDIIAFLMEKHRPDNGEIRWNNVRGSHWTHIEGERELKREIKELGEKGLNAIGYDFGAIDIIMDYNGVLYILEINSRPEFHDENATRFARAVIEYLSRE